MKRKFSKLGDSVSEATPTCTFKIVCQIQSWRTQTSKNYLNAQIRFAILHKKLISIQKLSCGHQRRIKNSKSTFNLARALSNLIYMNTKKHSLRSTRSSLRMLLKCTQKTRYHNLRGKNLKKTFRIRRKI